MTTTQWPDMIGRADNENCPYTRNEKGVRCPELGPGDCTNPTPRPTLIFDKNDRSAYEKAKATTAGGLDEGAKEPEEEALPDIPLPDLGLPAGLDEGAGAKEPEEGALPDIPLPDLGLPAGVDEGAGAKEPEEEEPEEGALPDIPLPDLGLPAGLDEGVGAKEPEGEAPEEGALPDIPLPDLGLPAGLDECVCDTWINITTCSDCTQQFWRSCEPEGCDEEFETREGCCQDCAPGSMFDGLRCKLCPAGSFKAEQGPGGCKGCPNMFNSEEGSTAMSDCKDPCEGCGLWIDVGDCPPPVYIHNFLSL